MISNQLAGALQNIISLGGRPISISYYQAVTGSVYDEADSLIMSNFAGSYLVGSQITSNLVVGGTITPDVTGIYTPSGTYAGEQVFIRSSGSWNIWSASSNWYLGNLPPGQTDIAWAKYSNPVTGSYGSTFGIANGVALISNSVDFYYSGLPVLTSGIIQCPDPNNAEDNLLFEQGKIGINDLRIYLHGSLILSPNTGSVLQTIIGIGSSNYSIVPIGAQAEEVNGTPIYKRAFIRRLTNGSLVGMV